MFACLKYFFTHPLARSLDIDTPETTLLRSIIIQKKSFLRLLYEQWYSEILNLLPLMTIEPILELGSGAGFLKKFIPNLITSEILIIHDMDVILDGQHLPFKKASLRSIVMIDVFHHIPDVKSFLSDAAYCLKPGGNIIMIEPWVTKWSRLIYKYLHHEPFEPDVKDWSFPKIGPLSSANGALPWIVFKRDRNRFNRQYCDLYIKKIHLHTPFSYLLSGGISLKSFLPGILFAVCHWIENFIYPFMKFCAMFAMIVIEKK